MCDQGVQELPVRAEDVRDPSCAGGVVRDPSGADHFHFVKAREYANTLVLQQLGAEYTPRIRISSTPSPLPCRQTLFIGNPAPIKGTRCDRRPGLPPVEPARVEQRLKAHGRQVKARKAVLHTKVELVVPSKLSNESSLSSRLCSINRYDIGIILWCWIGAKPHPMSLFYWQPMRPPHCGTPFGVIQGRNLGAIILHHLSRACGERPCRRVRRCSPSKASAHLLPRAREPYEGRMGE